MKTYLPYASFSECAACFSMKRLTKQRHDVMEILYLLSGRNHPTRADRFMYNSPPKKVWCNFPGVLIAFGRALCAEYTQRTGRPDPVAERLDEREKYFGDRGMLTSNFTPAFLQSESMHKSHRAILARQEPEHYAQFGFQPDEEDEKIFYWPVEEAEADFAALQSTPNQIRATRPRPSPWDDDRDSEDDSWDEDDFEPGYAEPISDRLELETCNCWQCVSERNARVS